MNGTFDVAVVGLGAIGSAVAYHLARRGRRVLGLDRFTPPHVFGSSHGQTRVIRQAYYEHPGYVPMAQRAFELWRALERDVGRRLLDETGFLMIGAPESGLISGALRSAAVHGLPYTTQTAAELRERYPALRVPEGAAGVWDPRAGMLFPEACVQSHLEQAARSGATLRLDEPVLTWEPNGDGVSIVTAQGSYLAGQLAVAAGPWAAKLLPGLRLPLTVERQVLYWFEPRARRETFDPAQFPLWVWEYAAGAMLYAFPELGEGVKIARHHGGETTDPDTVDREARPPEVAEMRALIRDYLPDLDGRLLRSSTCMYTNTPDQHFLIDFDPEHSQVLVLSPCSGHGFKFAGVIGEIAAGLLVDGRSPFDLSQFRLARLRA
ncbi:MAG: N-methyl-L-tryptophan oxidase [Chloroflexi bacterium]|nr:N-methyl-L-tryptophan oxidase [Chloroflexota bacterium]